jgi:hypothetical protein
MSESSKSRNPFTESDPATPNGGGKMDMAFSMCMLLFIILPNSTGPIDLVKAWEEAINSHQIESVSALYADDATIDYTDLVVFKGKVEIQGLFEWDRVMNTRLSLSNFRQIGDTLFVTGIETNDWPKAAGLNEQSYSSIKFTFSNGLVTFHQAVLSPESFQALIETSHAVQEWAFKERSHQVAEMKVQGKFVYNEATAKTNLDFVREWRKATKTK